MLKKYKVCQSACPGKGKGDEKTGKEEKKGNDINTKFNMLKNFITKTILCP